MIFTLLADIHTKLPRHDGIYTKSYQEARAIYDARIRNWEITYDNNLFSVKNNDVVETCYYERGLIQNCSCHIFADLLCGTCLHIEAIKLINPWELPRSKVRPIIFVNDLGAIQTVGTKLPDQDIFQTSAVKSVQTLKDSRKLPYNTTEYLEVDAFKDFGVNLYSFQKEAIQEMLRNIRSVLILRMGLGKTLCGLACCKILDKQKILIVAPNSLKYQWQGEINRFQLGSSLVVSKRADLNKYKDQRFLISSYEMLNSNRQVLEQNFDILIADEIQKIKNGESKTWETISKVKAEFVFALSGTPIQNNITDLISLVNFLNPMEFKPEWKFYEGFCNYSRARIFGIKEDKLDLFKKKVERYLINPRVDYKQFSLPTKKEVVISTLLTKKQLELEDSYLDPAKVLIAKSMNGTLTFGERLALNGLLTKARIVATDARLVDPEADKSEKFERVEGLLKDLVLQDKKVVVYSEWIKSLDLLVPYLTAENIPFVMFTGQINAKKRNDILNSFVNDLKIKVFLSTDAGGMGIDHLQIVSHNVVHLERVWNPMKIEQRNGRLIRALQKEKEVVVHYFHTNAEVENLISTNNSRKYLLVSEMLG